MGGYICLGFMILSIMPQSFWSYNQISHYVGKESFKDFWWWWWWWWWTVFVVWLTDERRSLISSRDQCQRSSPSRISDMPRSGFEPEFRLWWMKLCSSDNHYTTVKKPLYCFFVVVYFDHYTMLPKC